MAVIVRMLGVLDAAAARQHEDLSIDAHHVDVGAVELRQDRRVNDLVNGAERGAAIAEIEHPIKRADQLVDLMSAEQHRDIALARKAANQIDNSFLIVIIEADQRFVEQQELRLAQQRLRQQEALALATGHFR